MAIKELTSPSAFSQGAQLWITPQPELSPWTKRIDWYLNMQMRRAEKHQHKMISPQIMRTLEDNELPNFDFPMVADSPLLIASQGRLPVEAIVKVPFHKDTKAWIENLRTIWVELGRPQVRVFLPEQLSVEDVAPLWPEEDEHLISIVPFSTTLE
ncbi:MAG: hypothetical protein AAF202_11235 [Pseudomonadota bacterium]